MALAAIERPFSIAPYGDLAAPDPGDRRILIVDDDEAVRQLFADCLGARYSCATATNADEALARLADQPFALVISDMIMPGLSGVELLREIVTRYPDTAFIMASAIDRTQRVLDAVRLGAFDYLIKPCELDVLELCVERALERRTLLRDARRYKRDLERRNAELARRQAELQRLQAQIAHSEKMASLGQLAAGIAHELNNPAGFIYGNMELLAECVAGIERLLALYEALPMSAASAAQVAAIQTEIGYEGLLTDLRSIIGDCRHGAERIRDVVQNLRTFSRLDEAEFKKVEIHEGIESTLRLLSRYYSAGRIALKRDYGALPPVECYAGQLNQVWMNLLVNAAQAIKGDGEVTIKTRLENKHVVISISDTGSGITPQYLKRIFDPFFTTKPVGEGTGLGLSIAYGIIKRHGGGIKVQSVPGQGTTFMVAIPVAAARQELAGHE